MSNEEHIHSLISRSIHSDGTAFSLLVSEYQGSVFRIAFRLLCDEEEAKDVVQETFLKAWLSLRKYNSSFTFSSWVYKIACNICYDRLRSGKLSQRRTWQELSSEQQIASDEDIESSLVNKELAEMILLYTDELTPKQKMVFILREIEDRDISEIQTITGLSPGKIKSNLYLARKNIREKINKLNSML